MGGATEPFEVFIRRRDQLNEMLAESRHACDDWFGQTPLPPSMPALAKLEVLLKTRRDLLEELAELDDQFLAYLAEIRAEASSD